MLPVPFARALVIREKALGAEHPKVVRVLDAYAAHLRKINRTAEAEKLEARVKEFRRKLSYLDGQTMDDLMGR
jgi:hypothetical protein